MAKINIREKLAEFSVFKEFEASHIDLMEGCAKNELYEAGEFLIRETDPAEQFFIIQSGRIALETHQPGQKPLVIQTIANGDIVGWSWLFPPFRWAYDARCMERTQVISFNGTCLRDKCDSDHAFGYQMMKIFSKIAISRLQQTRLQLHDIYGKKA